MATEQAETADAPGILAIWHEVVPADLPPHEDWYRRQHLIERASIPGFRTGLRWERLDGGADMTGFFTFYETDSPAVLTGEDYAARLGAPTPWTQRVMPTMKHVSRTFCAEVAVAGTLAGSHAAIIRLSEPPGDSFWQEMPAALIRLAATPDAVRARLWRAADGTEDAPTRNTAEAKLRGGPDETIAGALVVETMRPPAAALLDSMTGLAGGGTESYRLLARVDNPEAVLAYPETARLTGAPAGDTDGP